MTTEDRLSELETRVAFQEHTLDSLNEVITKQELEIDRLTRMVKILSKQIKGLRLDDAINAPEDEPPPPHY